MALSYTHICPQGTEVKTFNINAHGFGTLGAEAAIPKYFCRGTVRRARREFEGVLSLSLSNSPYCDVYPVMVVFLWSVIDDYSCIRDNSVSREIFAISSWDIMKTHFVPFPRSGRCHVRCFLILFQRPFPMCNSAGRP